MSKNAFGDQNIEHFNRQVLACQEDAFSLACYLVGDEEAACAILQDVVLKTYAGRRGKDDDIGCHILRGVVSIARQAAPSKTLRGFCPIPDWGQLERREWEALLLVDMLGKSYPETAYILERSKRDVALALANARYKLTRYLTPHSQSSKEAVKDKKDHTDETCS